MAQPRAADDFAAIHARREELRCEREPTPRPEKAQPVAGPRPYAVGTDGAGMSLVLRRMLEGIRR